MSSKKLKRVVFAMAIASVIVVVWNIVFGYLDSIIPTYHGELIRLSIWTRYLALSFPMMIIVGRILKGGNTDTVIHVLKVLSGLILLVLLVLVFLEARYGIIRILDWLTEGDGFAAVVSFAVLGTIAVIAMYFVYIVVGALAAGLTLKEARKITF